MNYIDTLNTFLEHHFTATIRSAADPHNLKPEVPTTQVKQLLHGLSDNQFHNLIDYLKEEGHILRADAATITFCPHYIISLQPYPKATLVHGCSPQRGGRCFTTTC